MGNVLTKETRENIRYTEFENNQVLTADQLNDLFRYLDVQSRLTRTKGIGVGIICGLEIGLTDQGNIVVSGGSAVTSDGDLLHLNNDQSFDQFVTFDDINAKYDYFHLEDGTQVPLFELVNSKTSRTQGKPVSQFEQATSLLLKDHVGILYQEDYNNDTDLCTGTDCDNKGIECVRDVKILLAHKDKIAELLKSIPKINQRYFALEDIDMPRPMLKNTVSSINELQAAFSTALNIKDSLKANMQKAYEICKPLVEDDLNSNDPAKDWSDLLEQHFKIQGTIYTQYLYDFLRDLTYAYNEIHETLFNDNSICCPPVEIFPKHVMMGLVKTATVKTQQITNTQPGTPVVLQPFNSAHIFDFSSRIKFSIGALIKRFHPMLIDIEYRHQFYESPVLNNKNENTQRTKFCFQRIDAMIRNFKVPTADELQSVENIKIIPSQFEDRLLGERSIPFYYKYNRSQAINAYWNYDANVRKKENDLYYYFSNQYSNTIVPKDPLKFNLLPYSFFRIEGHIGFKYSEAEQMLNRIINENNLPINIISVQVESNRTTIPRKNWYFPELHLYEHFVRNAFIDHLDQVDLVHNSLKDSLDEKIRTSMNSDDIETYKAKKSSIEDSTNSFSIAKKAVLIHPLITQGGAEVANNFKNDIENLINKTNEIKRQTKEFAFSNTAIPHDFVINTDIIRKADLFADFTDQKINKKMDELILGNFLQKNPGLEHAGGVLRGGTFILVYRSNDEVVVGDFMLPYASIDKDIVVDPPKPTISLTPPRLIKKFDPKVIEIEPTYLKAFNSKIGLFDSKVATFNSKISLFDSKISGMDSKLGGFDSRLGGLDFKVGTIPAQTGGTGTPFDFNSKFSELNSKFTGYDTKLDDMNTKVTGVDSKIDTQGVQLGLFNSQLNSNNVKLAEFDTKTLGLESKLNGHDSKFADVDGKIGVLDNKVNTVDTRVSGVDAKVGGIDAKVLGLDSRVGSLDTSVKGINTKLNIPPILHGGFNPGGGIIGR